MKDVFIASSKRSPIGRLKGALNSLSAAEIGAQVIKALLAEEKFDTGDIDEVIIGQVLTGGAGQNPARQSALHAGIPKSVPAMTVNMVCGAGLRSIQLAAQAIKAGDANLIVAGGQDSMTQAPHFIHKRSHATVRGDQPLMDMMVLDGLWDEFNDIHMGETVEHLVKRFDITREEQDAFALLSQRKTKAAIDSGRFDTEITAIAIHSKAGEELVVRDEHPRPEVSMESLSALQPVFTTDGTITVGNASGLNDGASAVLVGSESRLIDLGINPMARIVSYAAAALDPMDMGLGPVPASRKALDLAGWTTKDLDVIELNEAFAAQAIAVNREMGWDPDLINPNGGAIALGHPLAASGNRIVTTLLHNMVQCNKSRGLATLCIGGGMGVALCLERV